MIQATIEEGTTRGQGLAVRVAQWAAAVLYNGLSRYDEAASAAREVTADDTDPYPQMWALIELVEAAARLDETELARTAHERLAEVTLPAGTDWALGTEARSRALLRDGEAADDLYREAIERFGRAQLRPELARSHLLYGEWLRREGHRVDARGQLRTAHDMFGAIGMEAFAERARRELNATGQKVRKRSPETSHELTPKRSRSLASHAMASRTRRSARSCSSVRERWSGTCARCSRRSASVLAQLANQLPEDDDPSEEPEHRLRNVPRRPGTSTGSTAGREGQARAIVFFEGGTACTVQPNASPWIERLACSGRARSSRPLCCSRSSPSPPAPERRSRTRRSFCARVRVLPDGPRWRTRCTRTAIRTATPALGLESVAGDVAIVRATLDSIQGDKILVGHSYGGFVITNAASGRSDVLGLVYTAAYVPDSGETITSLGAGYAPGAFLAHLVFARVPDRHRRPAVLPRGLRPGLESEAGGRDRSPATPHKPGPVRHSIRPGAWHALPSWYAVSGTTAPSTLICSGSWPSAPDRRRSSFPPRAMSAASRTTGRAS